ncbi:hypothetical protein U2A4042200006 [Corynebacterium striatum]|nr:hypothetical protein U2A4042200006 [Corynebacterium striatum]
MADDGSPRHGEGRGEGEEDRQEIAEHPTTVLKAP